MARLIQVIEAFESRGTGTPNDPHRTVRQHYSTAGELLAENDPGVPQMQLTPDQERAVIDQRQYLRDALRHQAAMEEMDADPRLTNEELQELLDGFSPYRAFSPANARSAIRELILRRGCDATIRDAIKFIQSIRVDTEKTANPVTEWVVKLIDGLEKIIAGSEP